jgi:hypothetical protein
VVCFRVEDEDRVLMSVRGEWMAEPRVHMRCARCDWSVRLASLKYS